MRGPTDYEVAIIGSEILQRETDEGSEAAREYLLSALRMATKAAEGIDLVRHSVAGHLKCAECRNQSRDGGDDGIA